MEKARYNADDFDIVEDAVSAEEFKKIRKAATNILYTHQSNSFLSYQYRFVLLVYLWLSSLQRTCFQKCSQVLRDL